MDLKMGCGTETTGGLRLLDITYPDPIPTLSASPPPSSSVGTHTGAPPTRCDPATQAAMHHGPVYENNSKNITTNDTQGSYNNSSITIQW